jgi:hypothetical protein
MDALAQANQEMAGPKTDVLLANPSDLFFGKPDSESPEAAARDLGSVPHEKWNGPDADRQPG